MSHEVNESDESVRRDCLPAEPPKATATCPIKVLAFHKLLPQFSFGSTNYSPDRFRRLLADLQDRGFRFRSPEDILQSANADNLLLTFDDGYRHLASLLPGLMENFDIKPLVFVPTAFIGRSNSWDYSSFIQKVPHLDRAEIREMADAGVRFGSHGHTHSPLDLQSEGEVANELVGSRDILEEITGREVRYLSYPFGRSNRFVAEAARKAGYLAAFTMAFPTPGDTDFARGRFCIYGFDSLGAVRRKLKGDRLVRLERLKGTIANRLSIGTILLNRIRGYRPPLDG